MKIIYLVLIAFAINNLQAQRLTPSTKAIVKKLRQYTELSDVYRGNFMDTAQQYHDYLKLRNTASTKELLKLTTNKNQIVKAYAGWALVDTRYDKPDTIFAYYLKTGDSVLTHEGCIIDYDKIANLFYYRFRYPDMGTVHTKTDTLYFLHHIKKLDSVLLYSGTGSYLLEHALENNNANPSTYSRIRHLAINENNYLAKIALAIYKKDEDITDLINMGTGSFMAVSFFPHEKFWDFLLKHKDSSHSLEYFLAVSSYKNESAIKLIEDIYPNLAFKDIFPLQEALTKNYCPLYQDMILKIWKKNRIIEFSVVQKLANDLPEKASEAFVYGLLSNDRYRFATYDHNYGSSDSILPLMLSTIKKYHPELLQDVVNSNIILAERQQLEQFLNCAETNHLTGTADNIIKKLDYDPIAYELFHLSKTLLSFKNSSYNEILIQKLYQDKGIWDWGNWSDSYRELFRNYNIKLE
jgi:hypothetical protein